MLVVFVSVTFSIPKWLDKLATINPKDTTKTNPKSNDTIVCQAFFAKIFIRAKATKLMINTKIIMLYPPLSLEQVLFSSIRRQSQNQSHQRRSPQRMLRGNQIVSH